MPAPRAPKLRHVSVTVRVSVDPVEWTATHDGETVEESVRKRVVDLLRYSREFVNVRRSGR